MPAIQTLAQAERALGKLAGAGEMLPNPHLLIGPFVRREAVLSSRIEGTIANEEDLVLFRVDPEVVDRRPDTREVRNYVTALEYGLKRLNELPVSLQLLKELHSRLLKGVRAKTKAPANFVTGKTLSERLACRSQMRVLCRRRSRRCTKPWRRSRNSCARRRIGRS